MKTEHRYEIIPLLERRGQAYIAEVPELQWCAADGTTYQEALANIEVVMDEWIASAIENGWTIPEPKGRRLGFA